MNEADALNILGRALMVTTELAVPVLAVSLAVGLLVSLLQAATQVQEATLTFVPKVAAIALVLLLMGHWMLRQLVDYTTELFELIPRFVNG